MSRSLRSGTINNHPYKTRSKNKRKDPGFRYTDNQQRILSIEDAIDPSKFENMPGLITHGINGSNLRIEYGPIVNGRRSLVRAHITREALHNGESPNYVFPFFKRRFGDQIVRGHVLARVLGGNGGANNLVPLSHYSANIPIYSDIEKPILELVEKQGAALVTIEVNYDNSPASHPRHVLPQEIIYHVFTSFNKEIARHCVKLRW